MALSTDERAFLKRVWRNVDLDKPLQPGSPFYHPLYDSEGCDDPVDMLQRVIDFSLTESRQFFSGFRGSGKTTELLRLKKSLEAEDYIVFYCNILEYINPAQAIDITDLLVVIAGAFSDAVEEFLPGVDLKSESYWTRFRHYLTTTEVIAEELKLTPLKSVAELKLALKDVPSFRQKLQEVMANRLYEFESQVKKFFEDYVKVLRARFPDKQIVFLVDQLEQLRGNLINEKEVIASVGRLFSLHMDRLTLPYMHVVYTVPPWLNFVQPGTRVVILHSVRQWERDTARLPYDPGDQCLMTVVRKRFEADEFLAFFGTEQRCAELVRYCGGNVRDLMLLISEAIRRAQTLPVSDNVIRAAVIAVRTSLLPIAEDEAHWLNKILETHDSGLPDTQPDSIVQFTRFLDTHRVLYLRNGEEWYDVHPLIREEVAELVRPK